MTWLYLLPAGFLMVLLASLAGAIGQRHHLRRMDPMSLVEDFGVIADVARKLKADLAAAVSEGENLKAELAAKVSEVETLTAKVSELEQVGAAVTQLKGELAPAAAEEHPAS